ncbi:MAG: hypothetical protein ACU0BK_11510 [Shimia sp.]|uniref:hypothetical protein n=1 Tax=Shimia sp. TaxID=1954381 RepID=UPI004059E619
MTKKNSHSRYREKNRVLLRAKQAMRRAGPAAPSWLTPKHHADIIAVYEDAEDWNIRFDANFVVHHIEALVQVDEETGEHIACGLHVPWNLMATTSWMNQKLGNSNKELRPIRDGIEVCEPWEDDDDDIPW